MEIAWNVLPCKPVCFSFERARAPRHFLLEKGTLWGICKFLLQLFKGTKAMAGGMEAIAFVSLVKYQAWHWNVFPRTYCLELIRPKLIAHKLPWETTPSDSNFIFTMSEWWEMWDVYTSWDVSSSWALYERSLLGWLQEGDLWRVTGRTWSCSSGSTQHPAARTYKQTDNNL